ncbi:cytochrome P450 [Streptomyces sp. TRM 70361]|uniref:cytochrome P450 n=1 Tax=Streptomyces sp. TRM 70361 TaxID=3116553 RepID=UPI002E7B6781|nr:cytochrome P450 [Streptomyces sp. TRM 70361]MEE1938169.1 cytochrome P450 [Streptomyces sp. TRM 70361]
MAEAPLTAARFSPRLPGPATRVTLPDGSRPWVVSRYADVRTVLSDPRFSADDQRPGFPRVISLPPAPGWMSFLRMDPPRHTVLRRMLTAHFTVRRSEVLRPEVERVTDGLLDAMAESGAPADLVECFALPLPSLVISRLLGVPYEDHAMFQEHSRNITATDIPRETALASADRMERYFAELLAARRARPGDDLISLALAQQEAAAVTDEEIIAMARLMLVAGHGTTANMLGMSVLTLLREPGRADALRAEPELVRPAVEELMRYLSVVRNAITRVATEEVRLSDTVVAAGEGVIVELCGANHDGEVFPEPGRFDPHRDPRGHVGFGYGIHQCIGQALARVELQVALGGLLRRFPGLRLAAVPEEIIIHDQAVVVGPTSLPVTW